MLRRVLFIAELLCCALLMACGATPSADETTTSPHPPPGRRAPQAVSSGDVIVAALRASQVENDPIAALAHVERALRQIPEQKELVWLASRLCGDVPRCEPEVYESRLRKLDPGNGVVWAGPLMRAQARDDRAAEIHILEALSREDRFDVYWNTLLSQGALALSAQATAPPPKLLNGPLTNAINDVSAWLSALAVPSLTAIAKSCSEERTRDVQIAERCRNVARVLQQGDTYAAEAVGLGIAQRSVAPDSPSMIALTERAAVVSYQHQTARDILGEQVEREKMSAQLIELMKKLRREQDVSLAVLRWAGVPLTP
ncbi:MAG: hypothetical protein C0P74_002455 [Gammaproteobacteria bacterium]|nr:hypothetical protein [Gammaproteobacteria bacterium]